MAVIGGGERPVSKSGDETEKDRDFDRIFFVSTDSKFDGPKTVLAWSGLPQRSDLYATTTESDQTARVIQRTPKQIGPTQWEVAVRYSTKTEKNKENKDNNDNNDSEDPADWSWSGSVSFENTQVPVTGDWADEPHYLWDQQPPTRSPSNSAGQPFDNPPPSFDEAHPVVTLRGYAAQFDPLTVLKYVNCLNQDNFWGANERQWRITAITTSGRDWRTLPSGVTVKFYPIDIVIAYNWYTWDVQMLDKGSYYLSDGKQAAFLTKEGQPFEGLLDGAGGKLADGAAPKIVTFKPYRLANFADLGLPAAFP